MTFYEYRLGMTVMDGNRNVAVARPVGPGGWLLTLHGACWTDHRARTGGLLPGKYPELMYVKTKGEARKIMRSLAGG